MLKLLKKLYILGKKKIKNRKNFSLISCFVMYTVCMSNYCNKKYEVITITSKKRLI